MRIEVREAGRGDRRAENVADGAARCPTAMRKWPEGVAPFANVLATLGRTEEIFAMLDGVKGKPELNSVLRENIFRPPLRDFWRDPRSMRVAKQLGVLDYWRTSGNWPDFCFEPDHPYDCKAVAGSLTE